jgi:hypothetical protein
MDARSFFITHTLLLNTIVFKALSSSRIQLWRSPSLATKGKKTERSSDMDESKYPLPHGAENVTQRDVT